jgi:hypothetical protein
VVALVCTLLLLGVGRENEEDVENTDGIACILVGGSRGDGNTEADEAEEEERALASTAISNFST